MTGFIGMCTEQAEGVEHDLRVGSERLRSLTDQLRVIISTVGWTGPDRDDFGVRSDAVLSDAVPRAIQRLIEMSAELEKHRDEQLSASEPDGLPPATEGVEAIPSFAGGGWSASIIGSANVGLSDPVGSASVPSNPFASYLNGGFTGSGIEEPVRSDEEVRAESIRAAEGDYTLTRDDVDHIHETYQVEDVDVVEWEVGGLTRILADLAGMDIENVEIAETEARLLDGLGPVGAYQFNENKDLAERVAGEYYADGEVGGHQDAMRHAYINALTARDLGDAWATSYWTAHEQLPGNDASSEAMDLYNNQVGRRIAAQNPTASDAELAELIFEAVENGEMIVIDGQGNLAPSNAVEPGETSVRGEGVLPGNPVAEGYR